VAGPPAFPTRLEPGCSGRTLRLSRVRLQIQHDPSLVGPSSEQVNPRIGPEDRLGGEPWCYAAAVMGWDEDPSCIRPFGNVHILDTRALA
jgi:hypothetical protein